MQRIGVFICWCGSNIAQTVDVEKLSEIIKQEPNVVYAENYQYMCSENGQALIKKAIIEHKLTAYQKGQLLSQFAKWYCRYVEMSNISLFADYVNISLMQDIINLKIRTLESIIEYDRRCNDNIQRIETSFMKSIKLMNDRVSELKKERKN